MQTTTDSDQILRGLNHTGTQCYIGYTLTVAAHSLLTLRCGCIYIYIYIYIYIQLVYSIGEKSSVIWLPEIWDRSESVRAFRGYTIRLEWRYWFIDWTLGGQDYRRAANILVKHHSDGVRPRPVPGDVGQDDGGIVQATVRAGQRRQNDRHSGGRRSGGP